MRAEEICVHLELFGEDQSDNKMAMEISRSGENILAQLEKSSPRDDPLSNQGRLFATHLRRRSDEIDKPETRDTLFTA